MPSVSLKNKRIETVLKKRERHEVAAREDYRTPLYIFEGAEKGLGLKFDLDVFASDENAMCTRYYTEEDNAFDHNYMWDGEHAWGNPPYTRTHDALMCAVDQLRDPKGRLKTVTLLIPAHTQNLAWHNIVFEFASTIVFYRSLIRFEGPLVPTDRPGSAMFPSALVVFTREKLAATPAQRQQAVIRQAYALTGEFE